MDTDETPDGTPSDPDETSAAPERQEPAALHADHDEHLQDPDAELSEALHVDTLAVENFRNPLRFN